LYFITPDADPSTSQNVHVVCIVMELQQEMVTPLAY